MPNTFSYSDPFPTVPGPVDPGASVTYVLPAGGPTWSPLVTPTPLEHMPARAIVLRDLIQEGYWVKATGSRVTENGWNEHSDWDYVVFDPEVKLHHKLVSQGWVDGSSGRDDGSFASLRLGDINLILVKEEDQWKKWIIATNMIKALNSKTKEERIKVFDAVFGKDKNMEAVSF